MCSCALAHPPLQLVQCSRCKPVAIAAACEVVLSVVTKTQQHALYGWLLRLRELQLCAGT
jgi:hypothetical protein